MDEWRSAKHQLGKLESKARKGNIANDGLIEDATVSYCLTMLPTHRDLLHPKRKNMTVKVVYV
jgi:hypothetical protein